jgi:diadenosine tetraphosphate (Ap4A) HIT family hydrolase
MLPAERIWLRDANALASLDAYPISPGHTLVIPLQHVASIFDLGGEEAAQLWDQVKVIRKLLTEQLHPDGFNIGLNDGEAAGQTVMHAHIHVIPRFRGDVVDPRGGIRWIIAEKAAYWPQ